ncbi:MAG TPA: alpha/beta hydrolase [Longimicrobiaceae bacterium]|nr:alpha/beta hydrolase [Longimicrobiaceae bacterium]
MLKLLIVSVVSVYVGLAVLAYLVSDRMIFLPPAASYDARRLPVRLVETEDGARLATLHLPNPEATFTLLYSHGNAEDLGHVAPALEELRRAGFAVLAFDYRGYGASTGGPPGAEAAYRDEAAVYRHATRELGIPPDRIVVYGRSVGSGPAVELAAREPVAGLVVESGFVSAYRVVTRIPLLPFDKFPNLRNIRKVRAPVLVIHGVHDEVIPVSHGRRLFAAAPEPKRSLWVEAGHNDVAWRAGADYLRAFRDFGTLLEEIRRD